MPLQATSGAASYDAFGGGVPVVPNYIEEVFSTWLYTGTGASQTITNNIDISTKGGLVWIKGRSGATGHRLTDTSRGVTKSLATNSNAAQATESTGLTAFGTTGFTIGADSDYNTNAATYVSWTFRKQPKFYTQGTYTGTGSVQTIAHDLGSVPSCIIIKDINNLGQDWSVYHVSVGNTAYLTLNNTLGASTSSGWWNNTSPTSSVFTVGTNDNVNLSGASFIYYAFAHNAGGFGLTGTDNVISCGSFTDSTTVNLGYEPQWVLIKPSSSIGNWNVVDNLRQWVGTDATTSDALGGKFLAPNLTNAESTTSYNTNITPTGFRVDGTSGTYIYIAIRRGPMKVPTVGTTVYNAVTWTGDNAARTITGIGFPLDMCFTHIRNVSGTSAQSLFFDRVRGNGSTTSAKRLRATAAASEVDYTSVGTFDRMDGFRILDGDGLINDAGLPSTYVGYFFKRAPSVFDQICFTGNGTAGRTLNHNLGVVPEMMIVKERNYSGGRPWPVYHSGMGNTKFMYLNATDAEATNTWWNDTTPTASVFTIGSNSVVNFSGTNYVAYLFATCASVSKVGSYTGTGTTLQIDCGFTAGARFVLIKRRDSTGDWYVWDTARGIVSGNDPYLLLNSTNAEVTSTDYIDPYSAGFELSSTAPSAINGSGGTFIFLAIA